MVVCQSPASRAPWSESMKMLMRAQGRYEDSVRSLCLIANLKNMFAILPVLADGKLAKESKDEPNWF